MSTEFDIEQHGAGRVEYGATLIRRLAAQPGIRGCSSRSLAISRKINRSHSAILQTASANLAIAHKGKTSSHGPGVALQRRHPANPAIVKTQSAKLTARFTLGWSHYATFLSIDDGDARRSCEIESVFNGWSVRELKRQVVRSQYVRLALDRDKCEVWHLAHEGTELEKASGLIKDPDVLEFTGPEQRSACAESDQKTVIIDQLQQCLLYLPSEEKTAIQIENVRRELESREDGSNEKSLGQN